MEKIVRRFIQNMFADDSDLTFSFADTTCIKCVMKYASEKIEEKEPFEPSDFDDAPGCISLGSNSEDTLMVSSEGGFTSLKLMGNCHSCGHYIEIRLVMTKP